MSFRIKDWIVPEQGIGVLLVVWLVSLSSVGILGTDRVLLAQVAAASEPSTVSDAVAEGETEASVKPLPESDEANADEPSLEPIVLSKKEWRRRLSRNQYRVLREHDTEPAFKNKYWKSKRDGEYLCAGCGLPVFDATTKFKSGTGWPSFYAPVSEKHVGQQQDRAFFVVRTEVHCVRCKGHLGHVFADGPPPTGLRYCINSAALKFEARKKD